MVRDIASRPAFAAPYPASNGTARVAIDEIFTIDPAVDPEMSEDATADN